MYLLFLLYPIIEIVVFFLVCKATSLGIAVLLTLGTSALGFILFRLFRRGILGTNNFTSQSIQNYLFGNLGAFALILPGFVSDVLGIIIIVPWTRRLAIAFLRLIHVDANVLSRGSFSVFRAYSFGDKDSKSYDESNDSDFYNDAIEGEIIDVDPCGTNESNDDYSSNDDDASDDDAIDVQYTVRS